MGLNLYNIVQEIVGQLPPELNILYSIFTLILGVGVLFLILSPMILVYKIIRGGF